MSIFELINLILFSKCCIFALCFATFKAFLEISKALTWHFFLSLNIDKAIHPLPVPMSKIFFDEFKLTKNQERKLLKIILKE